MQMKYIWNDTAKHLYHWDDSREDSNFSFVRRIHLLKSIFTTNAFKRGQGELQEQLFDLWFSFQASSNHLEMSRNINYKSTNARFMGIQNLNYNQHFDQINFFFSHLKNLKQQQHLQCSICILLRAFIYYKNGVAHTQYTYGIKIK